MEPPRANLTDVADVLSNYLSIDYLTHFANSCKTISDIMYENIVTRDRILQKYYSELVLLEFQLNGKYNFHQEQARQLKILIKNSIEKDINKQCTYVHKKGKQKGEVCGKSFISVDGNTICNKHVNLKASPQLIKYSIQHCWECHSEYGKYKESLSILEDIDNKCDDVFNRIEYVSACRKRLGRNLN
tara:strand:+ start:142 stop:702 length:561 start_codon:yes stop_codon:yes gene_type:complete